MPAFIPFRLSHQPEEKQPGDGAIGIEGFPCLTIDMRLNDEREISIGTSPDRHVAGIAMWQGALHELTRHESRLGRVGILVDLHRCIQKEMVCGAKRSGLKWGQW